MLVCASIDCLSFRVEKSEEGSSYAPSATKADVVGEDGGPVDVVVPMDGVDAVEHGDPEARGHGTPLDLVDHLHPLRRCRVGSRDAATTAQHAPCSSTRCMHCYYRSISFVMHDHMHALFY